MAHGSDAQGTSGAPPRGWHGVIADWSTDQPAFQVSWGKAMMWLFVLSDVFVFGTFLVGYMAARLSTPAAWPNTSEVFALHIGGASIPLLLIAMMTFILISSSGTMAMAVNFAYRRDRSKTALFMALTVAFGLAFVGLQAFEWSNLIHEGVRPWGNPMGAAQFGASFFLITGFHGLHVILGVVYLLIVAVKVASGAYERRGDYQNVEIAGLYWHFVDLVWVFIFAFFYLW